MYLHAISDVFPWFYFCDQLEFWLVQHQRIRKRPPLRPWLEVKEAEDRIPPRFDIRSASASLLLNYCFRYAITKGSVRDDSSTNLEGQKLDSNQLLLCVGGGMPVAGGDDGTTGAVSAAAKADLSGPLSTVHRRMLESFPGRRPGLGWFISAPNSGSPAAGNFVSATRPETRGKYFRTKARRLGKLAQIMPHHISMTLKHQFC